MRHFLCNYKLPFKGITFLILVSVLLLQTYSQGKDVWVKIPVANKNGDEIVDEQVYINTASLQANSQSNIQFLVKKSYKNPIKIEPLPNFPRMSSTIAMVEVNCTNKTSRLLKSEIFDSHGNSIRVIKGSNWHKILDDNWLYGFSKKHCLSLLRVG